MSRLARCLVALVASAAAAAACTPRDGEAPDTGVVGVFGPYQAEEATRFGESMGAFEQATGIDVRYVGTADVAGELQRRVEEASLPDVAIIPQLGLVEDLAQRDLLIPLEPDVVEVVEANYTPEVIELTTSGPAPVGVLYRVSIKSLVWYSPAGFAEGGYDLPTTLDELEALVEEMQADGETPWCLGLDALGATGWVATDWVEDLLLRQEGPEVYDAWVDGTVTFGDPRVADAFDRFRTLALAPGRVDGGVSAALREPVASAPAGLVETPRRCLMHRQATFARSWLPEDTVVGPDGDVDVFVLPGADAHEEPPLLVGADLAVALTESPAAQELVAYLATRDASAAFARAGAYVEPRTKAPPPSGASDLDRRLSELLEGPTIRADGSDSMPPMIGSDLLWDRITQWVAGALTYEDFARTLDAAREDPALARTLTRLD